MMKPFVIASAIFGLATTIAAQKAQYCSPASNDVCYAVNVPDQTAASGSGDIFFQIQGPSTMQWIGLGQGNGMSGANIFVIYASASGTNVTLSPRLGTGHVEPKMDTAAQVALLEGSGIANGKMTANVRCSNCAKWSGGSMDFKSSNTGWLWAFKGGSPIKDDSASADISQHDDSDEFTFDLTKARGGSSINPFVVAAAAPSGSTTAPAATGTSIAGGTSEGSGYSSGGSGSSSSGKEAKIRKIEMAHGTLMSLAFVIFLPMGAMIIRLLSFRNLVWVHAGIQIFAYTMALAGMGLGVYLGVTGEYRLNQYHPVIGLLVIGLLLLQPVSGHIHHLTYIRHARRTFWADIHVWYGRVVLTLGIINGGLGLRFAGNTKGGEIAYGVIAGVVWVAWMSVAAWSQVKGTRNKPLARVGEKDGSEQSHDGFLMREQERSA